LGKQIVAANAEESPGCSKAGFHLTGGWGNPRASATESRPPIF